MVASPTGMPKSKALPLDSGFRLRSGDRIKKNPLTIIEVRQIMRVRVVYFGMLKDAIGRSGDSLELPEGATVGEFLKACAKVAAPVKDFRDAIAIAVNQEYAGRTDVLKDGDEVAILPPVSGGSQARTGETPVPHSRRQIRTAEDGCATRVAIVRKSIEQSLILNEIKRPEDGAVSAFDGVVRDNTRGRKTLYLIYEAYEEMALKQMEQLCEEAIERFKVRDCRIVHRIGRLEVGETSVFIAVASAHRAAAMDACRFLIDTLKKTVPIWKKEYFEDGAVWADGEPFPEDIREGKTAAGAKGASK